MRLMPLVLASTCLLPNLFAQESHDDLRAEIRKIVREEIRAALADLKGGKAPVASAETKPATKTKTTRTIAVDTGKPTKSAAKAAAEEVAQIVLSLDDITGDVVTVLGDKEHKIVRTKATKKSGAKPKLLTLRCEDGKCTVAEGGEHDFVVVHGGGAEAGGECPVVNLGEGMFSLSFKTDGECCEGSEGGDCCTGGECCEGKEDEAGECCEEAAEAKEHKTEVRVIKPVEGKLFGEALRPKQVRGFHATPLNLNVEGQPIEIRLDDIKVDDIRVEDIKIDEVQLDTEPKVIEVEPLKIRSKSKKNGRAKQDNVIVGYRPLAV